MRGQKANADVAVVASNVDPAESDLTPIDPAEIVAAATGGSGRRRQPAPAGRAADARSRRSDRSGSGGICWWRVSCCSGVDTLVSNRLSKSVESARAAYAIWTLSRTRATMLDFLTSTASTPRQRPAARASSREVRSALALKLALRGARARGGRRGRAAVLRAAYGMRVGALQPVRRFVGARHRAGRRVVARRLLVPRAAAAAPGHRRAGGALSRRARAVAPGDAVSAVEASRDGTAPESAALVQQLVEQAIEACCASRRRRGASSRRRCARYGAVLRRASWPPRCCVVLLGPAFIRHALSRDAARVAQRRGGGAVLDRGHARQRIGAEGRRPDDHRDAARLRRRRRRR